MQNGHKKTALKEPLTPARKLGELIASKRRRLRWTQDELCEFTNSQGSVVITQVRLSHIERGAREATWFEMAAIAKALRCELVEFDF